MLVVTNPPADAGDIRDASLTPGLGGSPGGGHGNPLQCSCLENPMDRGAWQATVRSVAKSRTQLSLHAHTSPALEAPGLPKNPAHRALPVQIRFHGNAWNQLSGDTHALRSLRIAT